MYHGLHGGSSHGFVGDIVPTEPMRVSVDRTPLTAVAREQASRADAVPGTDGE